MRFVYAAFILSLTALLSVGCSIEVDNSDLNPLPTNTKTTSSPFGIKRSAGGAQVSGAQVEGQISIGLREREIKGTQADAKITISQTRPE